MCWRYFPEPEHGRNSLNISESKNIFLRAKTVVRADTAGGVQTDTVAVLHDGELQKPREEEEEAGDDDEEDTEQPVGVVRQCWVGVVLVEVDGCEQEDARAGGDEGVAEDDVPVREVVQQTPVIPLLGFYQKIVKLHKQFTGLGLILYLRITKYPIMNRR